MISKKVLNPKKSSSKSVRIKTLSVYIVNPGNGNEKCIYFGSRNFISFSHSAQIAEMLSLAKSSSRSDDPVVHYVISWSAGEQPTIAQVNEAVGIFCDVLGIKDLQLMFGLHADTIFYHLHLMVNRIDPRTERIVRINNNFDVEAVHQAIAKIEYVQGWAIGDDALYQVLENGDVARTALESSSDGKPSVTARDKEVRHGVASAQRMAVERATPVITSAGSWEQLHTGLAQIGLEYKRSGKGAVVMLGQIPVKASVLGRDAGLVQLEQRLGSYIKAEKSPIPVAKSSTPFVDHQYLYSAAKQKHLDQRKQALLTLKVKHAEERKVLKSSHRAQRERVFRGSWIGHGTELNNLRNVVATRQRQELAALTLRQMQERQALLQQLSSFPNFQEWMRQNGIEVQDHEQEPPCLLKAGSPVATSYEIHNFPRFVTHSTGAKVVYCNKRTDEARFIDSDTEIAIVDRRSAETVLCALQLAKERWGSCEVVGDEPFRQFCVRLAGQHRFVLANPELREFVAIEQKRIESALQASAQTEQYMMFTKYDKALGADSYRVTSIKYFKNGAHRMYVHGKRDCCQSYTASHLKTKISDLISLNLRGHNILFTPISEKYNYILVQLCKNSLHQFLKDGFKPAVVLETDAHNYQTLVKIPKTGTRNDIEAGNTLTRAMNAKYGGPKLTHSVLAHHAPGFTTYNPVSQNADDAFPADLLIHEDMLCKKAGQLADYVHRSQQNSSEQHDFVATSMLPRKMDQIEDTPQSTIFRGNKPMMTDRVYALHSGDIMSKVVAKIDYSRIDAMIAIRLKMTGHSQEQIYSMIRENTPRFGQQDSDAKHANDLERYAKRAAAYAFSEEGDKQIQRLKHMQDKWIQLESSSISQKKPIMQGP